MEDCVYSPVKGDWGKSMFHHYVVEFFKSHDGFAVLKENDLMALSKLCDICFDKLLPFLRDKYQVGNFTYDDIKLLLSYTRYECDKWGEKDASVLGHYERAVAHGYLNQLVQKCTRQIKQKENLSGWERFEFCKRLGYAMKVSNCADQIAFRLTEVVLLSERQRFVNEEEERRRRLREEQRALKELKKEKERAEKDEQKARESIEKNRLAMQKAKNDAQVQKLQAQIAELEIALQRAIERKERAISMAQQTRCGYVYVISNIGSFGEGVYKIGMTRRIDPMQRVRELGDASVPFPFDVHAMIYTEDAPGLESHLHRVFDLQKVNAVNWRKEYFRVPLSDIRTEVEKSGIRCEWVETPEASQYHDSEWMRRVGNLDAEELQQYMQEHPEEFPEHSRMYEYNPFEELEEEEA